MSQSPPSPYKELGLFFLSKQLKKLLQIIFTINSWYTFIYNLFMYVYAPAEIIGEIDHNDTAGQVDKYKSQYVIELFPSTRDSFNLDMDKKNTIRGGSSPTAGKSNYISSNKFRIAYLEPCESYHYYYKGLYNINEYITLFFFFSVNELKKIYQLFTYRNINEMFIINRI